MRIHAIVRGALICALLCGTSGSCPAGSPYIWKPSYSREIGAARTGFLNQRAIQRVRDIRMNADLQRRMRSMKERVSAPLGSSSSTGGTGKSPAAAPKDRESRSPDGSRVKEPQGAPAQEKPNPSGRDIPEPTTEKRSGQVERETP